MLSETPCAGARRDHIALLLTTWRTRPDRPSPSGTPSPKCRTRPGEPEAHVRASSLSAAVKSFHRLDSHRRSASFLGQVKLAGESVQHGRRTDHAHVLAQLEGRAGSVLRSSRIRPGWAGARGSSRTSRVIVELEEHRHVREHDVVRIRATMSVLIPTVRVPPFFGRLTPGHALEPAAGDQARGAGDGGHQKPIVEPSTRTVEHQRGIRSFIGRRPPGPAGLGPRTSCSRWEPARRSNSARSGARGARGYGRGAAHRLRQAGGPVLPATGDNAPRRTTVLPCPGRRLRQPNATSS